MIIVNGWKLLTIITKNSTLDVTAVLDLPLISIHNLSIITITSSLLVQLNHNKVI